MDLEIKENKKRNFRGSISNYNLDSDYYLCYLHTKEEEKFNLKQRMDNNNHLKKKSNEIEFYRIPTVKNVLNLLDNIHRNILHQGENYLIKSKNLKFIINEYRYKKY